ncbi:hypothetical protein R1flu_006549 [Riccia fluitans]|uniref:Uncharacterized protein n=1 Tax=Riccia fluitans TaxID=41844 RepID=A0ABD1YWN9_9MARC
MNDVATKEQRKSNREDAAEVETPSRALMSGSRVTTCEPNHKIMRKREEQRSGEMVTRANPDADHQNDSEVTSRSDVRSSGMIKHRGRTKS